MKRFFATLFLTAVLLSGAAYGADEIAFIDIQEVFKQFYKTLLAQDQIRQQADDIKMEREEIGEEVKVMQEEIEVLRTDSRDETLSDEVRENKRSQLEEKLVALRKKEQDLADFETLRMKQMEQQNTRMTKKLYDEIHEAVIKYARAQSFLTVIDRSAQSRLGTDFILYTNPKTDITADVLAILNEGRETTEPVAPETPEIKLEEE
ncbi:MAG: OmpH family outer membrane protein [Pontiella sp.]|nr:OmpH family outer membrane protein [Pontiella sp.]MBT8046163.1 OmpH family outer membrane protein [Pontiella sp.]NNJ70680.1 OmpH family outer membrane protein [Kiritimatiellales bacterium]